MFTVVKNAIPAQYQEHIASLMNKISWKWHGNTSYADTSSRYQEMQQYPNIVDNGQFTHPILDDGTVFSSDIGLLIPVLYMFADKVGVHVNSILRIRINLTIQDKTFTQENYNYPHTDMMPSRAFLYYINDSDGDTVLFKETAVDNADALPEQFNIMERITPEAGKGVFFDSCRFHASSNPVTCKARYVINFNFI